MDVPAFFVSYSGNEVKLSDGKFSVLSPKAGTRFLPFKDTVSGALSGKDRSPAVFIDCESFKQREFSEKVMKHMRVQNTDIWFMTYIETVDDVFDAFNKDAELVLAPYHFIASDAELKDINDVSDSVVPVVFVHNGRAVLRGRRSGDVLEVMEKLVKIGYYKIFVLDMERSLDEFTWSVISSDYPSTIPFVGNASDVKGFEHVITPYLL